MGKLHKNNNYRQVYEQFYGKIPKGYHIHHKDKNPLNNDPSNLIMLTPEEHAKIHENDFVLWASIGGKLGGLKAKEQKIGWMNPNITRKGTPQPSSFSKKQSERLKKEYESGERIHWTEGFSKEDVSRKISEGDPGKGMRGKPSKNKGKKFKRSDKTKENLRNSALSRPRKECEICGKNNLDAGNYKIHMKNKHKEFYCE